MAILSVYDKDGNRIEIPAIKGDPGKDGLTPHIGENGNWWIGETDTGVKADGKDVSEGTEETVKKMSADLYSAVGETAEADYLSCGTQQSGYVRSDGSIGHNEVWKHHEFSGLTVGEQFLVKTFCIFTEAPAVVFFNSENAVLSVFPENESGYGYAEVRFDVPAGAVTMKINECTDGYPITVKKVTAAAHKPKADLYNVLYGKSLICLGDSITYGLGLSDPSKVWGNLIAQRNGMTFTNAGISGSTMGEAVDGSNTNPSYKNNRHLAVDGKDYALIWFGWNDHNFCSLGTPDGADAAKTLVAYRLTLEYIIKNFVETKVGVIIPYLWDYNEDPQDHSIMEMLNGVKAVCDLCGVPYLDLPRYNFLPCWGSDYPNNEQYYQKWDKRQQVFTSDTLHPNEKGNQYLSTIIEGFLRTL